MQNNLNIRGEPVQSVYSSFKKGQYIVNRRYQRKLVWARKEKQKFIDSIINHFPVPLFLGVVFQDSRKGLCFEILDGMQRLEAITSFIEGRFPVNGEYFDLGVISETMALRDRGVLKQNSPKMGRDACAAFLNYPLPISTTTYSSPENVDETFRRINTGGVRLSRHEVRQAGSIGEFPQLVRRCATYIRGDVSHRDIVDLQSMHEISLTYDDLDYGIKVSDTFWNRYHVLGADNILESRDEELIAHTVSTIIFGKDSPTSSSYLDRLYASGTAENTAANDQVLKLGVDYLYKSFCAVFDDLRKVFDTGEKNLAVHLYEGEAKNISKAYQVIFLAVYDLIINKNMKIKSPEKLNASLKGIASRCMPALFKDQKWLAGNRDQLVKSVRGVISDHFVASGAADPASKSWVENFETILHQSRTENVCYDFKVGCIPLSATARRESNNLTDIIKTLTAMHNSNTSSVYVVLGVSDREETARRHKSIHGGYYRKVNEFFVCGVGGEAAKYFKNIDGYQQFLYQSVENSPISEDVKRNILRNTLVIKYYDQDVVVMKMDRMKTPAHYDGKIFVRKMANTDSTPISTEQLFSFFEEFKAQGEQYPNSF